MNQSIKSTVFNVELAKDLRNDMVIVKEKIKKITREIKAILVPPLRVRGQAVLNEFNSFPDNPDRAIFFYCKNRPSKKNAFFTGNKTEKFLF